MSRYHLRLAITYVPSPPLCLRLSVPPTPQPSEDTVERTLCQIRTVHVFKIPPRLSAGGYRASDWKEEVWQGALKVVQKGLDAAILLIDPKNGKAQDYAASPLLWFLLFLDSWTLLCGWNSVPLFPLATSFLSPPSHLWPLFLAGVEP